jgi:hypothetical protein
MASAHGAGYGLSKSSRSRNRNQLSRAQIKAYEARRAAEGRRLAPSVTGTTEEDRTDDRIARRARTLTRAEEFQVIKADLRRLLLIMLLLAVVLIIATVILR